MQLKSASIAENLKKLSEKEAKLTYKKRALLEMARKQETKRLIEIGRIAARFELGTFDDLVLTGAFAEIQEKSRQPTLIDDWKKKGERLSSVSHYPLLISFEKEPNDKLKAELKDRRFKWNSFRKEWQGYGIKDEIEKLTQEFKGSVEVVSG